MSEIRVNKIVNSTGSGPEINLDSNKTYYSGANLFSSLGGISNTSNKTILTSYLSTPSIGNYSDTNPSVDAAPLQVGIGAVLAIDKTRVNPAAVEFYKTRGSTLYTQGALQAFDAIGALQFSGSNGTDSVVGGSFYCNIGKTWSSTENSVYFRYRYAIPGNKTLSDKLLIGYPFSDADTTGPNTVWIPSVPTTVASATAGWDASNRLIKSSSSIKYKTQVEDVEKSYSDNVLNLRPVWYRSKTDADKSEWSWYGLIAEEVAEIDPRLVHWGYAQDQYEYIEDGPNQYKTVLKSDAKLTPEGVQYDRIGVLLLNVIKEQKEKIESLENRIQELESKL